MPSRLDAIRARLEAMCHPHARTHVDGAACYPCDVRAVLDALQRSERESANRASTLRAQSKQIAALRAGEAGGQHGHALPVSAVCEMCFPRLSVDRGRRTAALRAASPAPGAVEAARQHGYDEGWSDAKQSAALPPDYASFTQAVRVASDSLREWNAAQGFGGNAHVNRMCDILDAALSEFAARRGAAGGTDG